MQQMKARMRRRLLRINYPSEGNLRAGEADLIGQDSVAVQAESQIVIYRRRNFASEKDAIAFVTRLNWFVAVGATVLTIGSMLVATAGCILTSLRSVSMMCAAPGKRVR
jgi:hypothetical protein